MTILSVPAEALDKSSARPNVISVPKGPGSIGGLGESFEANLNSGSVRESVAIALPPGTAGHTPSLALSYDSGQGNGPLGMGWSLGLSTIQVQTEKGLPRYDDTERFLLDGAELVPVGSPTSGIYRLKNEGRFIRVRRFSDHWEVDSPDGRTLRYGVNASARIEAESSGRTLVFSWALEEVSDPFGNLLTYSYFGDRGQVYLSEIAYNQRTGAAQNRVVFDYETRPDPVADYRSRFPVTSALRLKRISVFSWSQLIRRYQLAYDPSAVFSLLASVTEIGSDDATALPPVSFTYSRSAAQTAPVTMQAPSEAAVNPGDTNTELVDIDGDGFVDLLHAEVGSHWYCLNQGGKRFGARTDMPWSPSLALSAAGVEVADLNGDGLPDLLSKPGLTSSEWLYFPNRGRGAWEGAIVFKNNPPFNLEAPNVRLLDFDHDKLVDVIQSTNARSFYLWRNRGDGTWDGPMEATFPAGLSTGFEDPHLQLADMNGDRLLDLVYLLDGAVRYWPSLGWGRFGPPIDIAGAPAVGPVAESELKLSDVNGDGLTDIVRVATDHVDIWPLLPGNAFGGKRTITGTPIWDPASTAIRLADMNGNGTVDVVWSTPSAPVGQRVVYLDLVGDVRPNLLTTVENGLGKHLVLEYGSSGAEYQRARELGKPWDTRLPFPVQVLAKSTIADSRGGEYVTTYEYRNGYYDAGNREFRGFGRVLRSELGETDDPTEVTVHDFDLGIEHEALKGREVAVETRTADGGPLVRVERHLISRVYARGADGRNVAGCDLQREETTHYEGGKPGALIREEWTYDDYGNRLTDSKWGRVENGDPRAGNDESFSTTSYLNDPVGWILGRPEEESIADGAGKVLARTRHYYDGSDFVGLPLGQMTRGVRTRDEQWVEADRWIQTHRVAHDGFGNVVASLSPRGARREIFYDDATHTFPVSERVLLEENRRLEFRATYVGGTGLVDSFTDATGAVSRFAYDALGRLAQIIKPGDSVERPTFRYTYDLKSPVSRLIREERPVSGQDTVLQSIGTFDGLGRSVAEVVQAEGGRWVVSHRRAYSRRGSVLTEWDPYFADTKELSDAQPSSPAVRYGYDELGRRTWTVFPDGARTEHHYGALWREDWDAEDLNPASPHHGTPMRFEEDGLGRTVRAIERLGSHSLATRFDFDAAGRRTGIAPASGNATIYGFDGLGRVVTLKHPDAGTQGYVYDDDGNVLHWRDAMGQGMDRTFDIVGRIGTEKYVDASGAEVGRITYHYDAPSPKLGGGASSTGKLSWVEDLAGQEHFAYDERGRMKASVRVVDGKEYRLEQERDNLDHVTAITYPDGVKLDYRYNERGLLSSVPRVVRGLEYDAYGLATRREYANGVVATAGYDAHQRVETLVAKDPSQRAIQDLHYVYDMAGTVRSIEDRVRSDGKLSAARSYVYDDLYRLVSAKSPIGTASFDYDAVGNLVQKSDVGVYAYGAIQPNAVQSIGGRAIAYNANGAMTSSWGRGFEYDPRGELRKVTGSDGSVTEYLYDYEGHRVVKKVAAGASKKVVYLDRFAEDRDGQLFKYVFAGDVRLARVGGGTPQAMIAAVVGRLGGIFAALGAVFSVFGAIPFAFSFVGAARRETRRRLGQRALALGLAFLVGACQGGRPDDSPLEGAIFYTADHLGSAELLTDSAGKVVGESSYDPWGLQVVATNEPHGFADKEWDAEAGLFYFGSRYYDPRIGRFLTVDPAALNEPERSVDDPQSLNPYAYARNTPTSLRDRDGRFPHVVIGALVGAAINTGIYLAKGAINGEQYTARGVLAAAASGAVTGAVAAATGGLGLLGSGAAAGVVGGVTERAIQTGSASSAFDGNAMMRDAALGAGAAGLAKVAGAGVSKIAGAVKGRLGASARELAQSCGGNCSAPACFVAGTLVTMATGEFLPIEEVREDDWILAPASLDQPHILSAFRVVATSHRLVGEVLDVTLESQSGRMGMHTVTREHPFAVPRCRRVEWMAAELLKPGDEVVNGKAISRVASVAVRVTPTVVYNLEVETAHAYLVGAEAALVHNGQGCGIQRAGGKATGGGGRSGALNEAKRDLGIPRAQHPDTIDRVKMTNRDGTSVLGPDGRPIMSREYTYTRPDGSKVVIQDHSAGHQFGEGGVGDQGPHFNVRPSENTRTGTVPGTQDHYRFER